MEKNLVEKEIERYEKYAEAMQEESNRAKQIVKDFRKAIGQELPEEEMPELFNLDIQGEEVLLVKKKFNWLGFAIEVLKVAIGFLAGTQI